MKLNFFSKKSKCNTCGKKFRTDRELSEHSEKEHGRR
jgi:uncharacterized C2H2 Zn-finger protein